MKLNKIMKLFLITILSFTTLSIILVNKSNATAEANKVSSTSSKTINDALEQCYEMKNSSSSLGNNSLAPHLSTPKDIGIALFLGLSSYGATTGSSSPQVKVSTGTNPTLSDSGSSIRTTTGNMTGIFSLGENNEWMAGRTPNLASDSNTNNLFKSEYNKYINMVIREGTDKNANIEATKGMPYDEITRDNNYYFFENYAVVYDSSKLTYFNGMNGRTSYPNNNNSSYRYRPCIWNYR